MNELEYLKAQNAVLFQVVRHYAKKYIWRTCSRDMQDDKQIHYGFNKDGDYPHGWQVASAALEILAEMEQKRKELEELCERESHRYTQTANLVSD